MSPVHSSAGGPPGARSAVPGLLSPEAALALILHRCSPLAGEVVELSAALGRVLREPVKAGRCLPPWDSSAMDGYAVRAGEVQLGQPLPVVGVIAAGHPATAPLAPGTVVRIMTGAPLPAGADAVIMKEEADEQAGAVRFRQVPTLGQHVRRAGEDIADGEGVLPAGAAAPPRARVRPSRRPRPCGPPARCSDRVSLGLWRRSGGRCCRSTGGRRWRLSRRGTSW